METLRGKRLSAHQVESMAQGIRSAQRLRTVGSYGRSGPHGVGVIVAPVPLGDTAFTHVPWVFKTTAAPGGGTVTAKRVDSTGTVQGDNITFTVL